MFTAWAGRGDSSGVDSSSRDGRKGDGGGGDEAVAGATATTVKKRSAAAAGIGGRLERAAAATAAGDFTAAGTALGGTEKPKKDRGNRKSGAWRRRDKASR